MNWFERAFAATVLLLGAQVLGGAHLAAAQTGSTYMVEADRGEPPVISAQINGQSVRLLVAPDAPRFVLLNPDAAERLGLRSNPLLSMGVRLDMRGDVSRGRTGRARIAPHGAPSFRQRLVWFEDIVVAEGADGVIGAPAFKGLDSLIIQINDPERAPDTAMNVALFPGRYGLEWSATAQEDGLPLELRFSFSRPSTLDKPASSALERAGKIEEAAVDLQYAPFWFIDRALAFEHENRALDLQGVAPDQFLRFAQRSEIEIHQERVEYERTYGPIDTITVRGVGERQAGDPHQVTLGGAVLLDCWRVEFYYTTGAVILRCPR